MPLSFSRKLIEWYTQVKRDFPWRKTSDPWRILVSELMLQQTRASVVIPYYNAFLEKFPDAAALADAPEQDLLAAWSGLGYYSRARNLQNAAKQVVAMGGFPSEYQTIRALKGVGDYTAAAVGSIAFSLPYAVLDGNVMRVTARLTDDAGDIGSVKTKQRLQAVADNLMDRKRPGAFNQGMMELGATICLPRNPQCLLCPVSEFCEGRKSGRSSELPVKLKTASSIAEEKTLFLVEKKDHLLLRMRPLDAKRLAGFWELPEREHLPGVEGSELIGAFQHTIVNHRYTISVRRANVRRNPPGLTWVAEADLKSIPLSTTAKKALRLASRKK